MLKILLKNRMQSLLNFSFKRSAPGKAKKGGKGSALLYALLLLYVAGIFVFAFGALFGALAEPFQAMGLDWLYFTFVAMLSFVMVIMGGAFITKTQLYESHDNELLLSMPIPPSAILGSRIIMLLLWDFVMELLVAAPAAFMWIRSGGGVTVPGALAFAVMILCVLLLAFAVCGLLGWLLALITARVRNKTLISTVFMIAFLAVYFWGYSKVNAYLAYLVLNGAQVAQALTSSFAPVCWFGMAVAGPGRLYIIHVILLGALPFALVCAVLSATFIRTATSRRGVKKIQYRERAMTVSAPVISIMKKELRRLFTSAVYLTNAGLGPIFTLAAAGFVFIKSGYVATFMSSLPFGAGLAAPLAAVAVCALATMSTVSSCSVSLEGKSLWIPLSLPIRGGTLLLGKALAHMAVTLPPCLLLSAALCLALRPAAAMAALLMLVPAAFVVFSALLGVRVNLRLPRLDWTSETQPVKQGASGILTMGLNFLAVLIPAAVMLLVAPGAPELVLVAYLAALLVLSAALYITFSKKGDSLLAKLAD